MKKLKKLLRNKKGVSSLFIMLYVALTSILLLSTLFFGLSISDSSLTSYLRVEQARMQENILIYGPGGLNVNLETGFVDSVRVNNTGAITVRIRAIYIDEEFICDPSEFTGDSYITPQDSLLIQLSSFEIAINDVLDKQWTITTERGTKSSELGSNLWIGPPIGPIDPNKLYFGPLLLIFNTFHWNEDAGPTWNDGWSIPKNNNNVIWRILIANIDDRQIILEDTSSFALIQNSQQSNKILVWNLDNNYPNPDNLTLDSGKYYLLYFSSSNPQSLVDLYSPIPVASNFLTFIGNFVEQDGELSPFGQTIPFEAVFIAD